MRKILCIGFIISIVSGICFAEKTQSVVEDRFCGSFFSGRYSGDGGATWNKIELKKVCQISKQSVKMATSQAGRVDQVIITNIGGIDYNIIKVGPDLSYVIGKVKGKSGDYYIIKAIVNGKEVIRFICVKE